VIQSFRMLHRMLEVILGFVNMNLPYDDIQAPNVQCQI